ncbi:MAG: YeeE/YedE thiosulfate transporter family protein [Tissierellia bacterium]|nr:YeeE/YedE thiosulfate transporter family protein [Tissierellia bacterium]
MDILLAICLGGFFGFALYFVGAANTANITNMLRLRDMTLAKIILFAIGFAGSLVSLLGVVGWFPVDHFSIKTMHLGVVLGGAIFGIGFGLIGTCPGTCPAAVGAGFKTRGWMAILGGLCGAWLYGQAYGSFVNLGIFERMNFGNISLFHLNDSIPSVFTVGFGGLLVFCILLMGVAYALPERIR